MRFINNDKIEQRLIVMSIRDQSRELCSSVGLGILVTPSAPWGKALHAAYKMNFVPPAILNV
jgi:hypothetical protein